MELSQPPPYIHQPQPLGAFPTVRSIQAWIDRVSMSTSTPCVCALPFCYEISRPDDDYCVRHACHLCHQAPPRVQLQNAQGFCTPCYNADVRPRLDADTSCYPVFQPGDFRR